MIISGGENVYPAEVENAERLLGSLAERLARYKLPTSVVFTDEIPRNGTGKILKTRLRATYGGARQHTDRRQI